jgi:hypothetical protein
VGQINSFSFLICKKNITGNCTSILRNNQEPRELEKILDLIAGIKRRKSGWGI